MFHNHTNTMCKHSMNPLLLLSIQSILSLLVWLFFRELLYWIFFFTQIIMWKITCVRALANFYIYVHCLKQNTNVPQFLAMKTLSRVLINVSECGGSAEPSSWLRMRFYGRRKLYTHLLARIGAKYDLTYATGGRPPGREIVISRHS